ncbi:catalase [Deinococcus metalli]|uniref:Catalase n=1 Tax=Deinococcus metalli TaxID=1141878 RepID=A0A7W8KJE4_9DEIO|nr:catalase [Deinococcus metalli]MBB5379284.1 catalase [Deinococcus metalli]
MPKPKTTFTPRAATSKEQTDAKRTDLQRTTSTPGEVLTDTMGHPVRDDQNSLRAGERGPTLMEDFLLREKIHHFDHERIPERVVHARGAGAHGYFQLDESLAQCTTAPVLTEVGAQTPVFVRFSTVAGSRGSADTARDVRGFAVRLCTQQGNWDIVGNNIPVFFIQDAIKFPDLIHAVKPEPHNEIPQAASAHDTFYDFISLTPESMHMLMWVHSDRAIPRSFDTMEGFGVHTFRLINRAGESHFVKFHWKPVLGLQSLVWDEAQKIAGKDPDFHRRTMWDTIERGGRLEWTFGVQIFTADQANAWDFDVLDATKIVPEDLVPVQPVGRLVLNRNPDNYFAETEQVAFMTTNIVPGIDFSDDPLLQGRNFSYLDTQLSRLGSPNWPELPINRPVNPVSNNQRDGHMRHTINPGRVAYFPNGLDGPNPTPAAEQGFQSFAAPVNGTKLRVRASSFSDHYGQARLFWNSMTPVEREHITKSLAFELSKCEVRDVRVRMLVHLREINATLASQVALAIGEQPELEETASPGGQQDSPEETALLGKATSPTTASGGLQTTAGLTMIKDQPLSAKGRTVAVLAAPGVDATQMAQVMHGLQDAGAIGEFIGTRLGTLSDGVVATKTLSNSSPVLFDAVVVPGGEAGVDALLARPEALDFVTETYRHAKPLAVLDGGRRLVEATPVGPVMNNAKDAATLGLFIGDQTLGALVNGLAEHRFWGRPPA